MSTFLLFSRMLGLFKSKFKIIVIGSGRGGTSLLGALLDAHPKLEIRMEAHVPEFLMGREIGKDQDSAEQRLALFMEACNAQAKKSKLIWGNKITTEQLDFLKALGVSKKTVEQLVVNKLFKGRKVLFVLRDGRSCVYSKLQRTDTDFDTAVARWKESVQWFKVLKDAEVEMHVIRFEELLIHPEGQLKSICQFLDIPFDENMLTGTGNIKILEDYRQQGINAQKAKVPEQAMAYTDSLKEELRFLGYL